MIICQCRFMNCNKCTALVGEVDNEESYSSVGVGAVWKMSVPSTQFLFGPKTALNNKVHYRKTKK